MQKQDDRRVAGTGLPVEDLDVADGLAAVVNSHRPRLCPHSVARASSLAMARGNGVRLWDRSLAVIAWATWSALISRRIASCERCSRGNSGTMSIICRWKRHCCPLQGNGTSKNGPSKPAPDAAA